MTHIWLQPAGKIAGILTLTLLLLSLVPAAAEADNDQICTKDSDGPEPLERIDSASCGVYKVLTGHRTTNAGDPILLRYMVHAPKDAAKGIVVLLAGGVLNTGITGDASTGVVTTAGANFLVRSAQLFADAGYIAITIHRPLKATDNSPEFPDTSAAWDNYRVVSAKHAYDIIRVVTLENPNNLPLFLAGTSRGALSVVANNKLGNGILISSPVTSGTVIGGCPPALCALYVGYPYDRLQANFVTVPVHVMAHKDDACPVTTPADALALQNAFVTAGIDSRFDWIAGGFAGPDDVCEALNLHGFLGQENEAVKAHTKRMDDILKYLKQTFPGNLKPIANPGAMSSSNGYVLNLADLVSDPSDTLTYLLPHGLQSTSWRDQPLSLAGSTVTYTPPPGPGPLTDGFTYVVSDTKGGISASYVVITIPGP